MSAKPNQIGEWVRLIQTGTDQEKSAAWEALLPIIQGQVKWIRAGSGVWAADDLVDDAQGLIWELLREGKYGNDQNFRGWCARVLQNEFRKRIRSSNTRRRIEAQSGSSGSAADDSPAIALAISTPQIFSPEDIDILESWTVKQRVLTLTIAGLWRKVAPPDLWDRWVDEAGFVTPFPPHGFVDALDRTERLSVLAAATGYTANAISSAKSRYLKKLSQLPYIQGLKDE